MKRRTFIRYAAVAALAVMSMTACGQSGENAPDSDFAAQSAATDDLLALIQSKGEITIAMEGNWQPWTYHDENDTLTGYDVEIGQAIADAIGVKANFVEGEWDGLLAGLDSGRYNLMINGVDVTPEREEKYDFSDPYAAIRTALAVRSDNTEITGFADLNGKTTANSVGSTYMELAEQYGATVSGVDTLDETIQMVLSGRVDATLNAEVSFYDYLGAHPDAEIKLVDFSKDANQIAIPMRKGVETATLRAAVNDALKKLREDGTLQELSEKYFGSDVTGA